MRTHQRGARGSHNRESGLDIMFRDTSSTIRLLLDIRWRKPRSRFCGIICLGLALFICLVAVVLLIRVVVGILKGYRPESLF